MLKDSNSFSSFWGASLLDLFFKGSCSSSSYVLVLESRILHSMEGFRVEGLVLRSTSSRMQKSRSAWHWKARGSVGRLL